MHHVYTVLSFYVHLLCAMDITGNSYQITCNVKANKKKSYFCLETSIIPHIFDIWVWTFLVCSKGVQSHEFQYCADCSKMSNTPWIQQMISHI